MGTVSADVAVSSRAHAKSEAETTTPQPIQFFVTGFARFHSVPENPTEALVRALHLRDTSLNTRNTLACADVIEVAAVSARREVEALYTRIADAPRSRRAVVIHFGVDAGARRFALERLARNEATFTCADERGWTPIKHVIDHAYGPLSATRATRLPTKKLAGMLRERDFDVAVSDDAGRFVCNWLYFHSLANAERVGATALFVHVPLTTIASPDKQLAFAVALMECIADLPDLAADDSSDGEEDETLVSTLLQSSRYAWSGSAA